MLLPANMLRMDCQTKFLQLYPSPKSGIGIWYDIDQTLAPAYFAIDFMLFDRVDRSVAATHL